MNMRNLSTNRSNLSKENVNILKKIVLNESSNYKLNSSNEEVSANNINYNVQDVPEVTDTKIHDKSLRLLYKNLNENKNQRKPLVYFFLGFISGALIVLFLSAVVLVSDKDTIESDVKSVKENIIETEKNIMDKSDNKTEISVSDEVIDEVDENGAKVYVVKKGDTLGGIVNRLYGSSYDPEKVAKFKEANGLKSIHVLQIGQKLVVPD